MIFFKNKRILELQTLLHEKDSKIFDLERALFESQQFEEIAADKVKIWVDKHDVLLEKYKNLEQSSQNHDKDVNNKES